MANPNTMSTQFNFNVNIASGGTPELKNDARRFNKSKIRSGANTRKNIHDINFGSVAKIGLSIRQVRMANEVVGAYTGDRLTQRGVQSALTFAQYGVGVAVSGPIGIAYAAGDISYRAINYGIKRTRENQIARFIKDISGNNARNNSRSRGDKL